MKPLTAKQIEEILSGLRSTDKFIRDNSRDDLALAAKDLALRVIAAEKLVYEVERAEWRRFISIGVHSALTAYREASK